MATQSDVLSKATLALESVKTAYFREKNSSVQDTLWSTQLALNDLVTSLSVSELKANTEQLKQARAQMDKVVENLKDLQSKIQSLLSVEDSLKTCISQLFILTESTGLFEIPSL